MSTKFGLIVAATPKGEIGFKNTIPWRLKGDLKRFKDLTQGNAIIYGRNTLESFPGGKPLPNRMNIILSSTLQLKDVQTPELNVAIARDMVGAIEIAQLIDKPWSYFVGGAGVYDAALDFVDKAHVTIVHGREDTEYDTRITNFNFPVGVWESRQHETILEWPDYNLFPVPSHTYLEYSRIPPIAEMDVFNR